MFSLVGFQSSDTVKSIVGAIEESNSLIGNPHQNNLVCSIGYDVNVRAWLQSRNLPFVSVFKGMNVDFSII